MPVISTIVVIAGLAATAGSPFKNLISKGKELPISVDVITCKLKATAIVKAKVCKL